MKLKNLLKFGLPAILSLVSLTTAAQDKFPSKTVRLVVPFAAGGGNDAVARIMAEAISPLLGQQVIVDNRAGAGGNIGTDHVAKSAPDGYTIAHVANTVVVNPYLYKKLPFDIQKDLQPIGLIATSPLLIVSHPKSGVDSLGALVQQMKDPKSTLSFATPGAGTPHHFGMELLSSKLKSTILHVPYKGAAPALQDTLGGQVPVLVSTPQSVHSFIASGRLRAIAIMDKNRLPEFKDVPAVSELVPGFDVSIWHGLMVPAATSPAIVGTLAQAVSRALEDPAVQKRLAAVGFSAKFESAQQMKSRIGSDLELWKKVAESAKIIPD
ncbi:MAG: tripartite tricarboxylate transporter substrate binding protein [Pseudomonadota bacterium]